MSTKNKKKIISPPGGTHENGHQYDNMRNAAEHNPVNGSVENRKAFVQKMAGTQVAVREIEKHAQENAAIPKWSTSNKQHLIANWTEASGSRTKDEQGMCCIM